MTLDRRDLFKSALAAGVALSPASALAQTSDEEVLASINPELRPYAAQMQAYLRNGAPLSAETLTTFRTGARSAFAKPLLPDVPHERRQISGEAGQPDVAVYVVNAKAEGARPAILHMHGGGYVMGSAEASLPDLQAVCKALDCVAVSVEYRLAPETTYVGSIADNHTAVKWLHANAASLGADPARIAVMGESAGGGHAALLALAARDRGEVPIAFQCLIYPMLDDRTGTSRTMPPHVGRLLWTARDNRFAWRSFLGVEPGRRTAPRGGVPARVENLAGLPPAFIGVGSVDLFCDEDVDYAQRLIEANVQTELLVVPGAFHGFDALPFPSRLAQNFTAAKLDALRRGLGIAPV